jgi:hypothetical protein
MICGRYRHAASACFDEINAAVSAMTSRTVAFNAHAYAPPPDAIVYNFENVPGQVADPRATWPGHEIWDFSASNAAKYDAVHVPVGYHPTMERFKRIAYPDIDVVFTGLLNERRATVIEALRKRDLHVVTVPTGTVYGLERDAILARAKVVLNMLFYPDGVFPALRVAHLVANRVPVISEACPEAWDFVPQCAYDDLVGTVLGALNPKSAISTNQAAENAYERFKARPMGLPS